MFVVQKLSSKCFDHTLKKRALNHLKIGSYIKQNKIPAVDIKIYAPSFNICPVLLLKTFLECTKSEVATWVSEKLCLFVCLNPCLREFPLSAIANLSEVRCQQEQLMLLS